MNNNQRWCRMALGVVVAAIVQLPARAITAEELRSEARELLARTQPQQAAERLTQALALPGAAAGEDGAVLWLELADAQTRAGQPKAAMQSAERAWKLREGLWGPAHRLTLAALNSYLDNCPGAGAARQCEPQIAEAVRLAEALPQPDAPLLASLLRTQALTQNQLGRAAAALPLLDRAIGLWRQDADRHARSIFSALTGKAVLLQNLGRSGEGLAVLDELLPLQRAQLGERSDDVLATLRTRAGMLNTAGRVAEAEQANAEVLTLCEAVLGPRHPRTHVARLNLGEAQHQAGNYQAALATLDRVAQEGVRDGAPAESVLQARLYHAQALRRIGQPQQAVLALQALVADQLQRHGERHADTSIFVEALAGALQDSGDMPAALAAFERSYALNLALRGAQHPSVWTSRLNGLRAQVVAGAEVSSAVSEPIVQALTRSRGEGHPTTLAAAQLHAGLLAMEGRLDEALAVLQPLAERRAAVLGPAHPDTLRSEALLARVLARAGRSSEALKLLQSLQPRVERLRESLAPLGVSAPSLVLAEIQPVLAERAVLLAQAGRLDEAFGAIEAHKAQSLLAQLARQRALDGAGLPAEVQARLQQQAQQRAALQAALAGGGSAERRAELYRALLQLEGEASRQLDEARLAYPRFAQLMSLAPSQDAGLGRLGEGQALVHFLQGANARWFAVVGHRDGRLSWHELGVLQGLAESIEALRLWTGAQGQRLPSDAEGRALVVQRIDGAPGGPRWSTQATAGGTEVRSPADYLALRQVLGDRLLRPLLPALAGVQRLLIAPDGALGLLPWDALLVQGQPAVSRWEISQAASLQVLSQRRPPSPAARRLLAFGVNESVQADGQHWPGLPRAAQEAQALAALAPQGQAYTGARASEAELRRWAADGRLAGVRTLALAAHARFDPRHPEAQAVLLAGQGADPLADGVLFVSDWVALPLRSELLVMSACDTARGAVLPGEGLTGFAYAAQVAGNRDLLATLWPVRDGAAAEFVPAFMRRVQAGQRHAQALAMTKREFAASADPRRNSPSVWAAFVLVGG
jgi:CHAT domain-containing protein